MSLVPHMATIRSSSPRAKEWEMVFGDTTIPIKSPLPVENDGPDGREMFFFADVKRLSAAQRSRVITHISEKFSLPRSEVAKDLAGEHGLPIRAVDLVVSTDMRYFV